MPKLSFKPLQLLKTFMAVAVATQLLSSCHTAYAPSYFMDVPPAIDTVVTTVAPYNVPKIKYGDILSLSVVPLDQMSNLYQAPVAGGVAFTSQTTELSAPPSGNTFTVDKNGIIEVPLIGKVKLTGLTVDDAKELLREKYAIFYKSFTINLNFVNHKVTVLGEVARPGNYSMQTDQITIFDALGLAGDITVYGKKDNVLLLRDSADNKKHLVRLNLNSESILKSPYYYLKENDMVYVEPSKAKLASTDAYKTRNLAIVSTVLSFVIILMLRTHVI